MSHRHLAWASMSLGVAGACVLFVCRFVGQPCVACCIGCDAGLVRQSTSLWHSGWANMSSGDTCACDLFICRFLGSLVNLVALPVMLA